jgi:hypothetical protein
MTSRTRVLFLAVICGALLGVVLPAAAQAASEVPVIERLVASNCTVRTCGQEEAEPGYFIPKAAISTTEAETEGFTEAGGRVPFGVTDFKVLTVATHAGATYANGGIVPTMRVTHIRTDVAPGLATNPFAVARCTNAQFGEETVPGSTLFTAPGAACAGSVIGEQDATVAGGETPDGFGDLALTGKVYDLVAGGGETMANGSKLASLYGVALELPEAVTKILLEKGFAEAEEKGAKAGVGGFPGKPEQEALEKKHWFGHTLIKGNVEWGDEARGTDQGDYHDYFEIAVSPSLPLIRSRLVFEQPAGAERNFITNATNCGLNNITTTLKATDLEGNEAPPKPFKSPITLQHCSSLEFKPSLSFSQANTLSDQPDGLTTEVDMNAEGTREPSQVKSATIVLPPGMTLNPSAAYGLQACTPAQARIHSEVFGTECPEASKIGTVALEVPTLPAGSLTGSVYLGSNESGKITSQPYTFYVVADSEHYGVSVRLEAKVFANETTGQVTTVFSEPLPEQPFTSIVLQFDRNALTSIANPLVCGTPEGSTSFAPTAAEVPSENASFGASITGCAASLPFTLGQSTENETSAGGGHTSYTYNLARAEGSQYIQRIKTTLPEGVVGAIPAVSLCEEAPANAGTCPASSKIGTVTAASGSGPSPYVFTGSVYMTGPYNGAPYGLSIVVPANAGPFELGNDVSRATININPYNSRVTSEAVVPTIFKGIPIRLRSLSVNVNKQGFLFNPTNCSLEQTESEVTSSEGAVVGGLNSPLQVADCTALGFAPSFSASTSAKTSRSNGASLTTTLKATSGQANIASVKVQLPRQLPSRLTTLHKACTEAQFNANPLGCPKDSKVGTATVITPTLPGKMTGPAIFVSHGGAAFPDLDLVVEDQGVRAILVGNTNIKANVTTTTFASTPDVPVTSVTVSLPTGPFSALAAYGDICANPLVMPTTITGQNGKVVKKNTIIAVSSCGVKVVGHKVIGDTAYLTIRTFAAGRISGSGSGLVTTRRSLGAASKATTLKVPLSSGGRGRRKPFKVKIRVGFTPKKGASSSASVTVTFR